MHWEHFVVDLHIVGHWNFGFQYVKSAAIPVKKIILEILTREKVKHEVVTNIEN